MDMPRIILFALIGGIVGFCAHLAWHYSAGVSVFSVGPHAIRGTVYALAGVGVGLFLHLLISQR